MGLVGMDDQQREVVENELFGHSFDSAEARWEYERIRRRRAVFRGVFGVFLLAVFGYGLYLLLGGGMSAADRHGHEGEGGGEGAKINVRPIGSPNARVSVLAVVPGGSDCHSGIIKFLCDTATANQDRIRVEFKTMEELGKDDLTNMTGSYCAAVIINDKTSFEVKAADCDTVRTVTLVGTEPTHYSLDDVGYSLTAVYTKEYGAPETPLFEAKGKDCGTCDGGGDRPPEGLPSAGQELDRDESIKLKLPTFNDDE
ncbi:MAG: hypothetical protein KAI66_09205 [Lentisphaeria bacterium]|nr:hypothetical protein [Lentisphaeria bacterium]